MKRFAPFAIIACVALLTLGVGYWLLRAKTVPAVHLSASVPVAKSPDLGHAQGAPNAPVTLEEFGDFQCPYCGETSGVIRTIEKAYGPRLRVVFFEFPLVMHKHAREAAEAAEAAGVQGRFWEMHDLLYEQQASWTYSSDVSESFEQFALELHLNISRFRKDLRSPDMSARVGAQQQYGVSRGVKNTPTIFINGHELPPPFEVDRLKAAIDAALAVLSKP